MRDENGATVVEYGLIIAALVLAMILGLEEVHSGITTMYNGVATNTLR